MRPFEWPDHPRLSNTALHLSWTLTEPLLGQSATSAGSRSVSLASQPYCRMSLSTSYRSRRPHGSQTTDRTGTRTSDRNATIRPADALQDRALQRMERRESGLRLDASVEPGPSHRNFVLLLLLGPDSSLCSRTPWKNSLFCSLKIT
jgi:hypothetical protein